MGFLSLLVVALMPVLQLLLICFVGAILSSNRINILPPGARKDINKVVFFVFAPALIFGSLVKTITFEEIISWWFMPVNIGFTFLVGGTLGWIAVKILRPEPHLEGLIIANCSAGNLGYMLLIVIPAICNEEKSPFGDTTVCTTRGLAYNSLSMALGGFFIWTHAYTLMKKAGAIREKNIKERLPRKIDNKDSDTDVEEYQKILANTLTQTITDKDEQTVPLLTQEAHDDRTTSVWEEVEGILHQIGEKLMAPPTVAAIVGFIVGAIPWLKSLIIGSNAPLRVIEDSMALLGDGTIPCNILILGANLMDGMRKSVLTSSAIVSIIVIRYIALPCIGIFIVTAASRLGFLPQDPLYQYVLLLQYALPPATAIGIMAELFNVGQQEYSVIFLWTYMVAALALTFWSTTFMYILA